MLPSRRIRRAASAPARSRFRKMIAPERLEPRLTLSASSFNDKAYIDVGPSDNVAWDQPRVTVQLLTEDFPDGQGDPPQNIVVGPNTFNSWLLDTGANTTLAFQTAVTDMTDFDPKYETDGKFNELGVGGVKEFDVSIPYRFDFAGSSTFQRNKLLDKRLISNPDQDVSIFGPWGIVGMPAMTERLTTVDFTPWTNVEGFDLFMETDFPAELPEPLGPRYSIDVDNRISFSPEGSVVSGPGIPMWADLPFFTAQLKNNESQTEGNFLFDTGAQVSIISSRLAFEAGLDTNGDGVLNALDSNFARNETIGGIAGQTTVPVFLIDEVHVPTAEGPDLVWTDLQWIILDIVEGIDGVFGFDNLTSGWIEAFGVDGVSGYFLQSHFDFRGWDTTGRGKLYFDFNEEYFTLVDPLGPGAVVTESGDSTTVTENSVASDTYEIRLSQPPTANVTVTFEGNSQVGAVDAANPSNDFVVFTPQNWDVPQTVLVVANDDSTEEGYHRAFVRNISSSTDPQYDGVGMPRVTVGIVDDDFAGMMIIPTDGDTVVREGGQPDYYDIVLTTQPTEDVFILMQHVAGQIEVLADATNSPSLVFTPANWNVPQRVRVTAVDDDLQETTIPAYIGHLIGSTDEAYTQAFALQEKAFVLDNDSTDSLGPRVTDVIVSSSGWSSGFIDLVDGGGAGAGNGLGVSLAGPNQLDNLPWVNLDRIYVQFNEDVSNDFKADNVLLTGVNTANYGPGMTLSYGVAGENIGTISLATPLGFDVAQLVLQDALSDAAGNALDGEWLNGQSTISGNGTSGGSFNFRIDALPGDTDNSGGVNFTDVFAALEGSGALTNTLALSRLDVDGNGGVNMADVFAIYNLNGTILPTPPPGSAYQPPATGGAGGGKTGVGGFAGAALLEGFGGVSQLVTDGGRVGAELHQVNPFLRRALARGAAHIEAANAAAAGEAAEEPAIGNQMESVPPVDYLVKENEVAISQATDEVMARWRQPWRFIPDEYQLAKAGPQPGVRRVTQETGTGAEIEREQRVADTLEEPLLESVVPRLAPRVQASRRSTR